MNQISPENIVSTNPNTNPNINFPNLSFKLPDNQNTNTSNIYP